MKAKNKFIQRIASVAIGCLFSVASSVAEGGHKHAKLSPELQSAPSTGNVDIIVQYRTAPTEKHLKKVTAKGAKLKRNLSVIHGAAFKGVPAGALAELAADPDVAYISPDRPLKGSSLDYAPENVNAPWAWTQRALGGRELESPSLIAVLHRLAISTGTIPRPGPMDCGWSIVRVLFQAAATDTMPMVTEPTWPGSSPAQAGIPGAASFPISSKALLQMPTSSTCARSTPMVQAPTAASSPPSRPRSG